MLVLLSPLAFNLADQMIFCNQVIKISFLWEYNKLRMSTITIFERNIFIEERTYMTFWVNMVLGLNGNLVSLYWRNQERNEISFQQIARKIPIKWTQYIYAFLHTGRQTHRSTYRGGAHLKNIFWYCSSWPPNQLILGTNYLAPLLCY